MKNLIFVSLDTVRADVAYSGKFRTINSLREAGTTFLNTISSSPLTPVSHSTILSGLQPYHHGVRHLFKEKIANNVPLISERLKESGYRTGAVVSCPGMNRWYGFSRGFDYYDDSIPLLDDGSDPLYTVDVKKRGTAIKRAEIVSKRAVEWVEENKQHPFFFFVHFFDAHWPYDAPKKFGGDNAYEEEIIYCDHYLGVFIDYLKKIGLFGKTTIFVFSDHGEDLNGMYANDKGGDKLGHPEELGHGCLLYDQTQKTVLIIKDEIARQNFSIDGQVRLVDVAPTALDLIGINYKKNDFDGVSLVPALRGKLINMPAYSETFYPEEQNAAANNRHPGCRNKKSIRIDNKYKFIANLGSDDFEFYNLESDPLEKNNIFHDKE